MFVNRCSASRLSFHSEPFHVRVEQVTETTLSIVEQTPWLVTSQPDFSLLLPGTASGCTLPLPARPFSLPPLPARSLLFQVGSFQSCPLCRTVHAHVWFHSWTASTWSFLKVVHQRLMIGWYFDRTPARSSRNWCISWRTSWTWPLALLSVQCRVSVCLFFNH